MSSFVHIQYFVVGRLYAHLQSRDSQFSPKLTIFIRHVLWSGFHCQSDNTMASSFVAVDRISHIVSSSFFFVFLVGECDLRDESLYRIRFLFVFESSRCTDIFFDSKETFVGIAGKLHTLKKIRKSIARIIQTLDKPLFIALGIDISCPSQYYHLDLVGIMTSKMQRE